MTSKLRKGEKEREESKKFKMNGKKIVGVEGQNSRSREANLEEKKKLEGQERVKKKS